MEEIQSALREYGLDEKESALYLANLELGNVGMAAIAKKAKIKRPTAYVVFKTLEAKGLMGSFRMRNGLRFVATKPDVLLARAKVKLKNLESVIPNIDALVSESAYKPKITYYEGREGFLLAADESLKKPNIVMRHIGSLKEIHKVMTQDYDFNVYLPRRIKQGIFLKALYFPDIAPEIVGLDHASDLREIRLLPEKYNSNTYMLILEDKIIIAGGSKEPITVIIESKEIAFSEQQKFDLIWDLVGGGEKIS